MIGIQGRLFLTCLTVQVGSKHTPVLTRSLQTPMCCDINMVCV